MVSALPASHASIPVTLATCYSAWLRARHGKKPSANQLLFAAHWGQKLLDLTSTLRAGNWQPARTVSFVVTHPKTREIHAPDFADRVVHHILVPRLEALYEPIFIHHSYANRKGKGSHAAVDALQSMVRAQENATHGPKITSHELTVAAMQRSAIAGKTGKDADVLNSASPRLRSTPYGATASFPQASELPPDLCHRLSEPSAHYLQLDIHNFFNTIHRPTLHAMLCTRMAKVQARGQLPANHAAALQSLCHKLLAQRTQTFSRNPQAAALVPPHKRLANARADCGIPVGNLSSQFFANVYLNALDQFVKHELKIKHYVRYVDDFVLLSHSRAQLLVWQAQIAAFLAKTLKLTLKAGAILQPCTQGIDFLGYRVFAHHRWVRPRVVRHARSKLQAWMQRHHRAHAADAVAPADFARLQALLGSYWGHFAHANSARLRRSFFERMPWLHAYFDVQASGATAVAQPAKWLVRRHQAMRRMQQ